MDSKRNTVNQIKNNLQLIIQLFNELEETFVGYNKQQNEEGGNECRIIHFKNNPLEVASRARQLEFEKLKKENEKLTKRLELLEAGSEADVTRRIDEAGDRSNHIEALIKKVDELKQKEDKLLTSFSRMGREFREVFYLLTGLKVYAMKDGIYEISNMYAESEKDKLFLQLASDGTIQLLQNEYSDTLVDYIETYLEKADSFPAFLAAITLNLFNSANEDTNLSVDMMETTIKPKFR